MSKTANPAKDPRTGSELNLLRAEVLPIAAVTVAVAAWLTASPYLLFASHSELLLPFLSAILAMAALAYASYRLLQRSVRGASALLVGGTAAAIAVAVWGYSGSFVACLFAPLVLIAGLLLGPVPSVVVAGFASTATVGAHLVGRGVASLEVVEVLLVLFWTTAVLALLSSRPVYTALDWAWQSYEQALRQLQESQEHQGELNRVVKSLNEAYYRLEQVNTELARARSAAQEARQLKTEFAANISHELRTPLNLIIGFSEMMATAPSSYGGENLPPGYQIDVDAIYRNSRHLSSLIDDILDLSQVDALRMGLSREHASIAEIVREATGAVRALFDSKGLGLTVEVSDDLPDLFVDRTRIRQVLINLLNNASRFTERGGVRVRAWQEEGQVVVAVADTGIGIAPEDVPRAFEEFRQVDGSTRRRYGGSGLGLAVSKRFVELHGGSIWAESRLGVGSTFCFSLPLQESVLSVPLRAQWETWVRAGAGEAPAGRTLAVIGEDGARLFRRYVDEWRVVEARDAADVRRLAQTTPVHAVALTAPVSLEQGLGQVPDLPPGVPVVVCPLSGRVGLRAELHVFDYLVKPILADQVAEVLGRLGPDTRDVLIVDDDPEMVRLLGRMVLSSAAETRVVGAYGGAEALAALQTERPDVVFLDLLMPTVDGYDVIEAMRSDDRLQGVPVVVVTARGEQPESIRARALSVTRGDGLSAAEVLRCLQACLAVLHGRRQSSPPTP